jgi:hypothetical protein
MKTLKERRLEILEWEKNNRNISNRSTKFDNCVYSGEIGCAVGRLISDKNLCEKLDSFKTTSVCGSLVFNSLPENVKELGKPFLIDMQHLHDSEGYWNENGLSESGMSFYEKIKQTTCNC